jgi:hypothetical protein
MKLLRLPHMLLLIVFYSQAFGSNPVGFVLPDSVQEMTLKFKTFKNLIVIPVIINNSLHVNLILDTGCRNLVLFGKKFTSLLAAGAKKNVQFSGLGSGDPVQGYLTLNNTVSLESITGTSLPIVVVPSKNIFSSYPSIHGIIGYDIFLKFEIEINPREQTITFRPAATAKPPEAYSQVPLKIIDSRPVLTSDIHFSKMNNQAYELMIDTGSALGLLLKTTDLTKFTEQNTEQIIGKGLNGSLMGFTTIAEKLLVGDFEMTSLPAGITVSQWHNYASIGMGVLKDYILVLNYCKSYACFKKLDA